MKNIVTLDQVLSRTATELFHVLRKKGLSDEVLQWPIDNPDFCKKLVRFWQQQGRSLYLSIEHYIISVNYAGNKTISNLLKEGEYDRVDSRITDENFPTEKTGTEEEEIYLIHLNKVFVNGDRIIEELDKLGYKPANSAHPLALGAKHPDLQKQFPIAALGQHWLDPGGYRRVVGLSRRLEVRSVELLGFEYGWNESWCFAAVPK